MSQSTVGKTRLYIPVLLLVEEGIEFENISAPLFALPLFACFPFLSPPISIPRLRHHGTVVHVTLAAVSRFLFLFLSG